LLSGSPPPFCASNTLKYAEAVLYLSSFYQVDFSVKKYLQAGEGGRILSRSGSHCRSACRKISWRREIREERRLDNQEIRKSRNERKPGARAFISHRQTRNGSAE
jgi:hypothetical protein